MKKIYQTPAIVMGSMETESMMITSPIPTGGPYNGENIRSKERNDLEDLIDDYSGEVESPIWNAK
jgi:hypothetical protein